MVGDLLSFAERVEIDLSRRLNPFEEVVRGELVFLRVHYGVVFEMGKVVLNQFTVVASSYEDLSCIYFVSLS